MKAFVCLALLALVLQPLAHSQSWTGMVGTVTDPRGAVIPGATVTIADTSDLRYEYSVRTDANGQYSQPLMPGTYRVKVSGTQFVSAERRVEVKPGERKTVDFPLSPGISVIHFVAPHYTPLAKTARISADVIIHLFIAPDGTPQDLQVVSGHPMLNQAAIDAVKQWKFGLTRPSEGAEHMVVIRFRIVPDDPSQAPAPDHWVQPELPDRVTVWGEGSIAVEAGQCGPPPRRRALQCLYLWRCKSVPYGCQ